VAYSSYWSRVIYLSSFAAIDLLYALNLRTQSQQLRNKVCLVLLVRGHWNSEVYRSAYCRLDHWMMSLHNPSFLSRRSGIDPMVCSVTPNPITILVCKNLKNRYISSLDCRRNWWRDFNSKAVWNLPDIKYIFFNQSSIIRLAWRWWWVLPWIRINSKIQVDEFTVSRNWTMSNWARSARAQTHLNLFI
jgi:hypothetical protein